MKETYIATLKPEDEVLDFFLVKSIGIKLGSNKKQYLDLVLGDSSGEISGKKWDVTEDEVPLLQAIKEGEIVRIKGSVTEWNGIKQLRVGKIRKMVQSDGVDVSLLIKSAPEKGKDMFDFVMGVVEGFKDRDLKRLCEKLLTENKEKLLYYPAAQKNHHAELGGLLYHIKRMLMTGERICQVYTNLNADLVLAGVILHDMEKLNEIEANELGVASGYSFEGQLLGHIIQGIKVLDRVTEELNFPREKAIMLEHMILAHHYEPEFGSPKKPLFPEAEILHYLDMIDARMYDMAEALKGAEPGGFSERVWTLDNRRLYKPVESEL